MEGFRTEVSCISYFRKFLLVLVSLSFKTAQNQLKNSIWLRILH
jgi:hypothetical protein